MNLIQAFNFLITEPQTFFKGHNKLIGIRHFTKNSIDKFQILEVSLDEKSFQQNNTTIFSCFLLSGELFQPIEDSYFVFHESPYTLALQFKEFIDTQFNFYPDMDYSQDSLELQLHQLLPQLPHCSLCSDDDSKLNFKYQAISVLDILNQSTSIINHKEP